MQRIFSLLLSVLLSTTSWGQQVHVSTELRRTFQPTTSDSVEKRIAETAEVYKDFDVPRVALWDVAFPKDREEYESLNKHAVLLITAITHDPTELPLRRLYRRNGDKTTELSKIVAWRSETKAGSLARKVLGQYREDTFYLLPIQYYFESGVLLLDFSANRSEFHIHDYPRPVEEDFIVSDKDRRPKEAASVSPSAIREILGREFPVKLEATR